MSMMHTYQRWIAMVVVGLCVGLGPAQATPSNQSAPASTAVDTVALVPFEQQQMPALVDQQGDLVSLQELADESDGTVNIFALAEELEQAIQLAQADKPADVPTFFNKSAATQPAAVTTAQPATGQVPVTTQTNATTTPSGGSATSNSASQPAVPPSVRAQREREQTQYITQEQQIAKIKAEAEAAEKAYIQSVREEAYRQVELEAFPMSPEQIKKLRLKLDETQRAQEAYPGTPPKPVSTSLIVNLSPGTTPPVIRLGMGFVSSLVFVDATGAPWPIVSYDVGAPDVFNIQWDKNSNMLLLQSLKPYKYGNIAVNLVGLNTPVMLTLVPGQKVIDYRVDLRVQALGPKPNHDLLGDGLPANANALLLNFLNGAPPDAADALMVHGSHTQAWVFKNRLYVRSRFKVISPSWLASMTSADGTHVYELPKTPILLLSRHGKVVSMQLEGF